MTFEEMLKSNPFIGFGYKELMENGYVKIINKVTGEEFHCAFSETFTTFSIELGYEEGRRMQVPIVPIFLHKLCVGDNPTK